MANKQINEFPTIIVSDETQFHVKNHSNSEDSKVLFSDIKAKVLANVPAAVEYHERAATTNMDNNMLFENERSDQSGYTKTTLLQLTTHITDKIYPIGSIYCNYDNSSNPSTILGVGTWSQLRGRFLVGEGAGTDINNVAQNFPATTTGGEYTHRLLESEIPTHRHDMYNGSTTSSDTPTIADGNVSSRYTAGANESYFMQRTTAPNQWTGVTNYAGSNNTHNNIPPYQTVYMWRRVA